MNLVKNAYNALALVWVALFFLVVPAKGATVAIDEPTFTSNLSSASWSGAFRLSTFSGDDMMGLNNSGTTLYTESYDPWMHSSGLDPEVVLTNLSIIKDGSDMVLTLGPTTKNTVTFSGTSSVTLMGVNPHTTLVVGIFGGIDSSTIGMETNNGALDGAATPSLSITGVGFQGFATSVPVGDYSYITQVSVSRSLFHQYQGSQATLMVYGDHSLDSIPEPSTGVLMVLFGTSLLLKRSRKK